MIKGLSLLSTIFDNSVNSAKTKGLCVGCLSSFARNGLCQPCRADLPVNRYHCRCCALPMAIPEADSVCGDCLACPPAFNRALIPWRYQYPVSTMIGRYKYSQQRKYARPLIAGFADYLAGVYEASDKDKPQLLIPSPMLATRRRKRGFNQAADIAEHLGKALDIPVSTGVVRRVRPAQAQRGLNRKARLANLRGVFKVCGNLPERVAIVDDVVTTGATVRMLAQALQSAGARDIQVWALARTPG